MALRYFRFTVNPLSTYQTLGLVSQRLHFIASGEMIYVTIADGMWIAVDDAEMGKWGGPTDFLGDDSIAGIPKFWQEGVPVTPDIGLIPTLAAALVPFDTQVPPVAWVSPIANAGPSG